MNEEKWMEITRQVMSDTTPLPVVIDITQAWLLVSGLQLCTRHPGISEYMKDALTEIAHAFQDRIVELHPEAEELLNIGWNESFDVDENGNFITE